MTLTALAVGVLTASAIVIAAALVAVVQGGRRRGHVIAAVRMRGGARYVQPLAVFADAPRRGAELALHDGQDSDAALYNPSLAWVPRRDGRGSHAVATTRLSNYTVCPGSHLALPWLRPCRDALIAVIDGAPYRVSVPPAWWGARPPSTLQDARPLALAPGVAALVCTAVSSGGGPPRVAVVTLRLPLAPLLPSAEPAAVTLLEDAGAGPQKNWMPVVHGARLYLVKHVAPQTVVSVALAPLLAAERLTAIMPRVDLDDDATALALTPRCPPHAWRGSTPLMPWRHGECVAVVHRSVARAMQYPPFFYTHALAVFDAAPPFKLRRVSREFQLVAADTLFTFVSGLCQLSPTTWRMTFGADDCYEGWCDWPTARLVDLLAAGPDAPLLEHGVTIGAV